MNAAHRLPVTNGNLPANGVNGITLMRRGKRTAGTTAAMECPAWLK